MPDPRTPVDPVDERLNQGFHELAESDLFEVEATVRYMVVAIESEARQAPIAPAAADAGHHQADGAAIHQRRSQAPPSDLLKPTIPLGASSSGAERVDIATRPPGQLLPEDTITVSTTATAAAATTTAGVATTTAGVAVTTTAAGAATTTAAVVGAEVVGACQEQEQSDPEAASKQLEQEKKKQEEIAVELITPERVQELIEVGRTTEEGFRELIRFLGRTLSNPACMSASFSLTPHLQEETTSPGGVTPPELTPAIASDADGGACGGVADAEPDAPSDAATDGITNNGDARAEVDTNTTRSATDTAAVDGPATAVATEEPSPSCQGWADRSSVGMDVAAAAEVWRLLRKLDADAVTGAVLNALEALAQALYMESFLGRLDGGGRGSEATATATAAAAATAATAATMGAIATSEGVAVGATAEGARVNGGGGVSARERADMRAIVLGERPLRASCVLPMVRAFKLHAL